MNSDFKGRKSKRGIFSTGAGLKLTPSGVMKRGLWCVRTPSVHRGPGLLHNPVNFSFFGEEPSLVLQKAEPISLGGSVEPSVHGFLVVGRDMQFSLPLG
jgi:hypothetical protein